MPTLVDRKLRAVQLAKDCRDLGARARTIHHVTGLPKPELKRLLFPDSKALPRGRAPNSPEWYHGANLLYRAESSIVISVYRRLRKSGFSAGQTLVSAYRHYRSVCDCSSRISFDRAFDLASHADGIWVAKDSVFTIATCSLCGCQFLAAQGSAPSNSDDCPFCQLVKRYACDQRVQASFPPRSLDNPFDVQLSVMAIVCPGHQHPHGADGETGPQ
ncbi:FlhC family transcriptional regulator [Methylibium sp.]|uniref:FlhC family transcriptional regulator n=1 Tax=Methylibium sp. TaxID=2067992 RepID=UPI003D11F125